jgi:asparagine synthase (glutamine-hydrolysing)
MTDALIHRGPDGEGFFSQDNVALGHRRLKIIDLSEAAKQPIPDASGNAVVSYNGEIYNYRSLRDTLSARGHRFTSHGDSEVIPVAYVEWGDSFLEHLHGMFAFALYDTRDRRLVLARDRIGIKPLYIVRRPNLIAFASEIKAFVAAGLLQPRPNTFAIAEFIQRGYHLRGHSWYEGVYELPPGHYATVSATGDFQVRPFWKLPESSREVGVDPSVELRTALEHAALTHLQSDVPLGSHLSGGIDSSSVVALLSSRYPGRLKTFSVYFREGSWYDERPFIEEVSKAYSTEHHYTVPTASDAREILGTVIRDLDEPVSGAGVIPVYLLFRDIRARGIVVANGGQGGDEMFAGYDRHLLPYALGEFGAGAAGWHNAAAALRQLGIKSVLGVGARHILTPGARMLHRDLRNQVRPFRNSLRINDILRDDLTGYLPGLLQIEDRLSMAWSVESRVPLLDDAVIELAASMHSRWKVRDGVTKRVLRDAVHDLLPQKVLERRDKRGIPTPFGIWIRGPLKDYAQSILTDPMLSEAQVLDTKFIERVFKLHCSGISDLGGMLWRPIATGLWLQHVRSLRASSGSRTSSNDLSAAEREPVNVASHLG